MVEKVPLRPRVQSAARAVAILLLIAEEQGVSVNEISSRLGVSRQVVYHLLHTLTAAGVVRKDERGHYVLGLRVGSLVNGYQRQFVPAGVLGPIVQHVVRVTGETASASGWWNREMLTFFVAMGTFPVTVHEPYLFQIKNPHSRAAGKLLLSMADDDLVNNYLSEPLERLTPNTITSVADLQREFEQIRRDGYAFEFEESAEDKCSVSVPFDGFSLPFCVTIIVPTDRYVSGRDRYLEALQEIVATHRLRDDLKLQVD